MDPSHAPSGQPIQSPTSRPTPSPTLKPSMPPSQKPTSDPTPEPSSFPTLTPTLRPVPTSEPSHDPTSLPTLSPTTRPTLEPTTLQPTREPSEKPTSEPTKKPTEVPSSSPTRNPTTGPTSSPTCADDGNFNMCIAIDMGSLCSAGCGENLSTCCSNLSNMLEFTKGLITELGSLSSDEDFSIVHFGTNVTIASALESWRQSIETINQLEYNGGGSDLAGAISSCQKALAISPPNRKNVMLLMGVGAPSMPEVNPLEAAATAAMNARIQNTAIVPIVIEEPTLADDSNVLYLKNEISSDGQVFVSDLVDLNNLQEMLFEHLICLT
mmetsp:Transcript_20508/g.32247  ORF Transcript_20508/g.32247 Transcript_20508/m.32247 type:complete len:325 (+) Transcript_20508:1694-2668(+)